MWKEKKKEKKANKIEEYYLNEMTTEKRRKSKK